MIQRTIQAQLKKLAAMYPVVTITGPRQSGKTTLAKMTFPDYRYVSLENFDVRQMAEADPKGFLKSYAAPVILDEIQRVPALLSYIQTIVDENKSSGQYFDREPSAAAGSRSIAIFGWTNRDLTASAAFHFRAGICRYCVEPGSVHNAGLYAASV